MSYCGLLAFYDFMPLEDSFNMILWNFNCMDSFCVSSLKSIGSDFSFCIRLIRYWLSWIDVVVFIIMFCSLVVFFYLSLCEILLCLFWLSLNEFTLWLIHNTFHFSWLLLSFPHFYKRSLFSFHFCGLKKKTSS